MTSILKYAKRVFLQWKMLGTSAAFALAILFSFQPDLEKSNWRPYVWPTSGSRIMHRRDRGDVQQLSWSPDGSRIYYDRWYD